MPYNVSFISLGCAKNQVNCEQMMATVQHAGHNVVLSPEGADVAVVNTCGFLASACEEAIDNILEMAELKKEGIWFVCADMGGTTMYDLNLKGPIGLVIGNEGEGVGRLVKEKCDMVASIPMKGDIDSLNASVAAGVLAYEIVRQRLQ